MNTCRTTANRRTGSKFRARLIAAVRDRPGAKIGVATRDHQWDRLKFGSNSHVQLCSVNITDAHPMRIVPDAHRSTSVKGPLITDMICYDRVYCAPLPESKTTVGQTRDVHVLPYHNSTKVCF